MQRKKIGLALGGGAVLGAAHVGVIQALEENSIQIDCITGTSIGAFVAAFYAFGKNVNEMQALASQLKWGDITKVKISKYALLSNEKLGQLIVDELGDKNIEDARIPLAMVATDITTGKKVVLKKGPLAPAVMASTCIPGIFKPVEIEKKLLVDGGIVENVPIPTLRSLSAEFIIGVDLNAMHSYGKPDNIIDVMMNSFHFMMKQSVELQTQSADIIIKPDLSAFNRSSVSHVKKLMEKGYADTHTAMQKYLSEIPETKFQSVFNYIKKAMGA